jgi:putative transposase
MDNKLYHRKHPRLKDYDYSQNGCYFVTICTKERARILGEVVGRDAHIPPYIALSSIGECVEKYIGSIPTANLQVQVDNYVIMPNHIHLLISIQDSENGGGMWASRPTIQTIVRSLKILVSKKAGFNIWQTSYYDHIIRNETDYLAHWQYIDDNPAKWAEDEYYV